MTRCCYVIVVCLWPRTTCFLATYASNACSNEDVAHTTTDIWIEIGPVGRGRNSATNWVQWWFDRRFDPICLQFAKEIERCIRAGVTRSLHTPLDTFIPPGSPFLGLPTSANPVSPRRIIEWTRCNSNLWHVRTPWTYPIEREREREALVGSRYQKTDTEMKTRARFPARHPSRPKV